MAVTAELCFLDQVPGFSGILATDYSIRFPVEGSSTEVLRHSIERLGIQIPIICARHRDELFLLDGRRRFRVWREIGGSLPSIILDGDGKRMLLDGLRIHVASGTPNLIEQALYLTSAEFQKDVMKLLRIDCSGLEKRQLLLKLPIAIQTAIARTNCSMKEAELLFLFGSAEINSIARMIERIVPSRNQLRKIFEIGVDLKRLSIPFDDLFESALDCSSLITKMSERRSPQLTQYKNAVRQIFDKWIPMQTQSRLEMPGDPDSDCFELRLKFHTLEELEQILNRFRGGR